MALAEWLEGTPLFNYLAEAKWFENRLKAERAWLLDRRSRRAKPETELLLPRWGKSSVFSNHLAGAFDNLGGEMLINVSFLCSD